MPTPDTVLDVVQHPRRRQTVRWALLTAIVAVGLWAVLAFITAALDQISLEPTDATKFRAWTVAPQAEGGGIAAVLVVVAVVCWAFGGRRPMLQTVAAIVALLGVVALVAGAFGRARRSHPESARGRAVSTLALPPSYGPGEIVLQHPSAVTAPAATRTWSAPDVGSACSDLSESLRSWVDGGVVRPGANRNGRCYFGGTWHGHAVDANVVPDAGSGRATISVRLAG